MSGPSQSQLGPPLQTISGCSGVWPPPPKCRNKEARNRETYLEGDLHPVPDRRGISVSNPIRIRPPAQKKVQKIRIEVRDFSLDKAQPQFAAAIEAQIDCDDTSDDFIKEKLHSNIRSSSTVSMTRPYCSSIGRVSHCMARLDWCGRILCWFDCRNDRGDGIGEPKALRLVTRQVALNALGQIRRWLRPMSAGRK
jgi:hypothetical protein